MPAFREDKFSVGKNKCRSPILKRTWWTTHCPYSFRGTPPSCLKVMGWGGGP